MKSKRREGDGMVEGVLGKELGGFAENHLNSNGNEVNHEGI